MSCLKKCFGGKQQSFIENIRPGVKLELFTKYVQDARGLSSFCSFDFVLFWDNLDLVEFWFKSDSGLKIISKVQMLLLQTFVLKKKYSICLSRNFWTESSLAQEKTQNPTQLGYSHSAFYRGAWVIKQHSLYPARGMTRTWICLSSYKQFHRCVHDLILFPCDKRKMKILHFLICKHLLGNRVIDCVMLLWADVINETFG